MQYWLLLPRWSSFKWLQCHSWTSNKGFKSCYSFRSFGKQNLKKKIRICRLGHSSQFTSPWCYPSFCWVVRPGLCINAIYATLTASICDAFDESWASSSHIRYWTLMSSWQLKHREWNQYLFQINCAVGHVCRMDDQPIPKQLLYGQPKIGKRKLRR